MSTQPTYYTGVDIAARANVNYARVLAAIHSGELPALKVGGLYAVESSMAEAWLEQQRLLADPQAIQKLQEEVAELKAENRALRRGQAA